MAAYAYSYGSLSKLFKNSAEVAGSVCQQLRDSEQGLTPHTLVEASRDVNAPLHNEFEWDDTVAAEKYRIEQARCIIRHLIIVRTDIQECRKSKDRAFVPTEPSGKAYVPLHEALSIETFKTNLLKAAKADAERFVLKYNRLEELAGVIREMKGFLDEEAS